MTTDSILDFLDDRMLSGRRKSTVERYRTVLERLEADTGKDPLVVGHRELRLFLAEWRNSRSANGAAFMFRHLKAFYRWAIEEGRMSADPTLGIRLKAEDQPQMTADDDQVLAMLAFKGRTRDDIRDRAMLHLIVTTGARRSEIGCLTVADLNLDDCLIRIAKSKTTSRFVPITDETAVHVRRWLRVRPERGVNLWASTDGPALVGRVVGRRSGGQLTPHSIRRWFATRWLTRGGSETSLARLLGWSSTAMTAVYTKATGQQVAFSEYQRVFDRW